MNKTKGRNMTFKPNKSSSNHSNNNKTEQQKKSEAQIDKHKKTKGFWAANMEQRSDRCSQDEAATKKTISDNSKGIPMQRIQQELGELYSPGNLTELKIRIAFAKQLFVNNLSKNKNKGGKTNNYNHPFCIALQFITQELSNKTAGISYVDSKSVLDDEDIRRIINIPLKEGNNNILGIICQDDKIFPYSKVVGQYTGSNNNRKREIEYLGVNIITEKKGSKGTEHVVKFIDSRNNESKNNESESSIKIDCENGDMKMTMSFSNGTPEYIPTDSNSFKDFEGIKEKILGIISKLKDTTNVDDYNNRVNLEKFVDLIGVIKELPDFSDHGVLIINRLNKDRFNFEVCPRNDLRLKVDQNISVSQYESTLLDKHKEKINSDFLNVLISNGNEENLRKPTKNTRDNLAKKIKFSKLCPEAKILGRLRILSGLLDLLERKSADDSKSNVILKLYYQLFYDEEDFVKCTDVIDNIDNMIVNGILSRTITNDLGQTVNLKLSEIRDLVIYTLKELDEYINSDKFKKETQIQMMFNDLQDLIPPLNRKKFKMDPWQNEVCKLINDLQSFILTAPTSSGKSVFATYTLKHYRRGLMLFIVPDNSDVLAWQFASKVQSELLDGIVDTNRYSSDNFIVPLVSGDYKSDLNVETLLKNIKNNSKAVVGTAREFATILPRLIGDGIKISHLIIDEIHNIGTDDGKNFELIIKMIGAINKKESFKDYIPIMGLSATIEPESKKKIIDWLNSDDVGFRKKSSDQTTREVKSIDCNSRFFNLYNHMTIPNTKSKVRNDRVYYLYDQDKMNDSKKILSASKFELIQRTYDDGSFLLQDNNDNVFRVFIDRFKSYDEQFNEIKASMKDKDSAKSLKYYEISSHEGQKVNVKFDDKSSYYSAYITNVDRHKAIKLDENCYSDDILITVQFEDVDISDINPASNITESDLKKDKDIEKQELDFTPKSAWRLWEVLNDEYRISEGIENSDNINPVKRFSYFFEQNHKRFKFHEKINITESKNYVFDPETLTNKEVINKVETKELVKVDESDDRRMFTLEDVKKWSNSLINFMKKKYNENDEEAEKILNLLDKKFRRNHIECHNLKSIHKLLRRMEEKKMTPAIVFVHNTASALAFAKSLYCEIREETYKILSTKKSNKEKKEQKQSAKKTKSEGKQSMTMQDAINEKEERDKDDKYKHRDGPSHHQNKHFDRQADRAAKKKSDNVKININIDDDAYALSNLVFKSQNHLEGKEFQDQIQHHNSKSIANNFGNLLFSTSENLFWLIDLWQYGIAVYIHGLPGYYLRQVASLSQKRAFSFVISDKSLMFGVSMPFRTSAIVRDMYDKNRTPIDSMMSQQMGGRAGRRGEDTQGNVLYVGWSGEDAKDLCKKEVPKIYGVKNIYPDTALFAELLSKRKISKDIFLHNTFWEFCNMKKENKQNKERVEDIKQFYKKYEAKFDGTGVEFYSEASRLKSTGYNHSKKSVDSKINTQSKTFINDSDSEDSEIESLEGYEDDENQSMLEIPKEEELVDKIETPKVVEVKDKKTEVISSKLDNDQFYMLMWALRDLPKVRYVLSLIIPLLERYKDSNSEDETNQIEICMVLAFLLQESEVNVSDKLLNLVSDGGHRDTKGLLDYVRSILSESGIDNKEEQNKILGSVSRGIYDAIKQSSIPKDLVKDVISASRFREKFYNFSKTVIFIQNYFYFACAEEVNQSLKKLEDVKTVSNDGKEKDEEKSMQAREKIINSQTILALGPFKNLSMLLGKAVTRLWYIYYRDDIFISSDEKPEMIECSVNSGYNDSNDGESDDGKSDDGKSDDGKYDDGKSDDGKSDDGKSDDGKSDDGKSDDGKSDDGKSDDGKSDNGKSYDYESDNSNIDRDEPRLEEELEGMSQKDMASLNVLTVENSEQEDYESYLMSNNYTIRKVTGDGNCFFRCASLGLNGNEDHHKKLRKRVSKFLKNNESLFENEFNETKEIHRDDTFQKFCTSIGKVGIDVGQYGIYGVSCIFERPVFILDSMTNHITEIGIETDIDGNNNEVLTDDGNKYEFNKYNANTKCLFVVLYPETEELRGHYDLITSVSGLTTEYNKLKSFMEEFNLKFTDKKQSKGNFNEVTNEVTDEVTDEVTQLEQEKVNLISLIKKLREENEEAIKTKDIKKQINMSNQISSALAEVKKLKTRIDEEKKSLKYRLKESTDRLKKDCNKIVNSVKDI